jgi:SRSO17 transposase
VRVRVAHGDYDRPEEWLLIEWPKGEKEPIKYWLSTLPNDITFHRLVDYAKLRWRIERDYQELKQKDRMFESSPVRQQNQRFIKSLDKD